MQPIKKLSENDDGLRLQVKSMSENGPPSGDNIAPQFSELKPGSILGLAGSFKPLRTDFSFDCDEPEQDKHFKDPPHWSEERRKKVKKFRFVIATMALVAITMSFMSRMILNLAIVEMTRVKKSSVETNAATMQVHSPSTIIDDVAVSSSLTETSGAIGAEHDDENQLDWSSDKKLMLLAAFYMSYMPSMMFSGSLAETHGAKYPILVCVALSATVNLLTPAVSIKFGLVVVVRLLLGVVQGALIPSVYELFNKWLTITETSIFIPLSKMAIPVGAALAFSVPAIVQALKFDWPLMFYVTVPICAIWSIAWWFLATSIPQENGYVEPDELQRIMRKKTTISLVSVTVDHKKSSPIEQSQVTPSKSAKPSVPWIKIITSPSVIVLTIVKISNNLAFDFVALLLPQYLDQVHHCSTEKMGLIQFSGYLIQAAMIPLVGYASKRVVLEKTFGISRTWWRKIFQSISNFGMVIGFTIILFSVNFEPLLVAFFIIEFTWVFCAGGEAVVVYDLSKNFPASIMGFAHSLSATTGVLVPFSALLISNKESAEGWKPMFWFINVSLLVGGVLFVLILKAKYFLEEDMEPNRKETRANGTPL